jgi:hypothetical protein
MTRAHTARHKKGFLTAFAGSGNITLACRASGVGRRTVYDWQARDEAFALAFRQAEIEATEHLEAEAWRRAVAGTRRLRFDKDGQPLRDPATGEPYVEMDYSDTLLIFLLKARAPEKYRDRWSLEHSSPGTMPLPPVREIVMVLPPYDEEHGPSRNGTRCPSLPLPRM